ncbi:MAG: MBL fold metallo-hydrolase, partial [Betaproteobacteria bacterium]
MSADCVLPPGITVFERGWLSSNNILVRDQQQATLVDSGYCSHAAQTVMLLEQALGGQALDHLINTHLHSDHCGGNAALQQRFPRMQTRIPPGQAAHVARWDPQALSYAATGQDCPMFGFDALLTPGQELHLDERLWQVHAAPGHDPHAVLLFEPDAGLLISGDALWERGFGVVFPELDGLSAFEEVSASLDLIASLHPRTVIPGHGRVFSQVAQSLAWARRRLDGFVADPKKHAQYAAKVLLKFKLLELRQATLASLADWVQGTPCLGQLHERYFDDLPQSLWLEQLLQ